MVKKHNDETIQKLVRGYLKKLEHLASKHGLSLFVKSLLRPTKEVIARLQDMRQTCLQGWWTRIDSLERKYLAY